MTTTMIRKNPDSSAILLLSLNGELFEHREAETAHEVFELMQGGWMRAPDDAEFSLVVVEAPRGSRDPIMDLIETVLPWVGSREAAWAWYHNEPLVGLDNKTAAELVLDGRIDAVRAHLAAIANGGYS